MTLNLPIKLIRPPSRIFIRCYNWLSSQDIKYAYLIYIYIYKNKCRNGNLCHAWSLELLFRSSWFFFFNKRVHRGAGFRHLIWFLYIIKQWSNSLFKYLENTIQSISLFKYFKKYCRSLHIYIYIWWHDGIYILT